VAPFEAWQRGRAWGRSGHGLGGSARGRAAAHPTLTREQPSDAGLADAQEKVTDHRPSNSLDAALVARLWRESGAARWALSESDFARALERSLAHRFGSAIPDRTASHEYLRSLHAGDLALAWACAAGNEPAWDHFVREFRPVLYRLGTAVGGERGRGIADTLYADLFGLEERDGERRSLFRYYHGRSSLAGWLRSLIAQRVVDRARAEKRTEPIGDRDPPAPSPPHIDDPDKRRYLVALRDALRDAVAALDARDRLRLAMYYAGGVKLAPIGRALGESEATVSRKLDRTRRQVRTEVERRLRAEGLADAEVARCFELAVDEWPFAMSDVLPHAPPPHPP